MGFTAQAPCSDGCFPTPSGWLMYLTETGITAPYLNVDLVQQAVALVRSLGMFGDLSVPQLSLASNTTPDTTTYRAAYRIALRGPARVARVVVRTAVEEGTGPGAYRTPRPVLWQGVRLRAAGGECPPAGREFAWAYPVATSVYTAGGRRYAEVCYATPVGTSVGPSSAFELSGNFAACCPDPNYLPDTVSVYQIRLNPPADADCC